VSVDMSGNIYIADTGNQRIRELGGGAIATSTIVTIVGSGQQGFGGDGSAPSSVNLNSPRSAAPDALGNLSISDKLNQLVRAAALPTLTFGNDGVGVLSATQSVTLANTGTSSISVAAINATGGFVAAAGGNCSATPITLAASATCTQNIAFLPTTTGAANGSVVFSGTGIVPQNVLLTGTAVKTATTTTLVSSSASPFVTQTITFTATVQPVSTTANSVKPTGTVSFYDGTSLIGTAQTLAAGNGTASISTAALTSGPHNITAVYSGDANFITSTTAVLVQSVLDFNFTLTSSNPNGVSSQTVVPGQTATFAFNVQPVGGPFTFPVALSATGLPPGATVTFTPNPITMGASPASFTMSIQVPQPTGKLDHGVFYRGSGSIALALLLLPFSRRFRRMARRPRPVSLLAAMLFSIAAIGGLAGCGSGSGFFGVPQQTYTINVIGTATSGAVVLQHTTTVTLTVE
jgi:hypothetical protein